MIEIKKNFLSNEALKPFNQLLENNFGWFFRKDTDTGVDDGPYFIHTFFKDGNINSDYFELLEPVLFRLKLKKLIHVRANLYLKKTKKIKSGYHIDFSNMKTTIVYLNTNNGYTEFENKTKVKSIENSAVTFDSNIKHRAVYQTDKEYRLLLNLNYE